MCYFTRTRRGEPARSSSDHPFTHLTKKIISIRLSFLVFWCTDERYKTIGVSFALGPGITLLCMLFQPQTVDLTSRMSFVGR